MLKPRSTFMAQFGTPSNINPGTARAFRTVAELAPAEAERYAARAQEEAVSDAVTEDTAAVMNGFGSMSKNQKILLGIAIVAGFYFMRGR